MRKTSVRVLRYFNPLPPCGGRRYRWICASFLLYISIHSLRVEGDISLHFFSDVFVGNFNPLPPCGGRHHCTLSSPPSTPFQSTPSVWRETFPDHLVCRFHQNFNPLPPCGGRPSIPPLLAQYSGFQSTPSVWRETIYSSVPICI